MNPKKLSIELLELSESVSGSDMTLGELVNKLEGRVYTLLLVLLALPFCQPIMLPGLSTPFGLVIAILGLRFAMRRHPWLPERLMTTRLTAKFLPSVMRGGAKILGVMEKLLHPRIVWLFEHGGARILSGTMIFICGVLLLLPLPVPFSNMLPALAVVLIASAFSERDGFCLGLGCVLFALTIAFFTVITVCGIEVCHTVVELF